MNSAPLPSVETGVCSAGGPNEPEIRFLLLSQNIGTFDCTEAGLTEEVKQHTVDWVSSASKFRMMCASKLSNSGSPIPPPHASTTASTASLAAHGAAARLPPAPPGPSQEFDVVVVHLQEIGGKKYNADYIDFLSHAVRGIWPDAGWSSGLLLHTTKCDQTFTAMGSIVFVSPRIRTVTSILSLHHRSYISLDDDPHSYVEHPTRLFHGRKFSDADTSRKGYLFFSLRVGTRTLNFVNLHLYHDADNKRATEQPFPSEYAVRRSAAFKEALEQIMPITNADDPMFIFGDLNTRLDCEGLYKHIHTLAEEGEVVTVGKKKVGAPKQFWEEIKRESAVPTYLRYDKELQALMQVAESLPDKPLHLAEMPIAFPPTYVKEESEVPVAQRDFTSRILRDFKTERFPGWCDRVIFNPAALALVAGKDSRIATGASNHQGGNDANKVYLYNAVTLNHTDHDGVYLAF
jgi:inositol-1,4,5-trisphosphate 5-phosphatase